MGINTLSWKTHDSNTASIKVENVLPFKGEKYFGLNYLLKIHFLKVWLIGNFFNFYLFNLCQKRTERGVVDYLLKPHSLLTRTREYFIGCGISKNPVIIWRKSKSSAFFPPSLQLLNNCKLNDALDQLRISVLHFLFQLQQIYKLITKRKLKLENHLNHEAPLAYDLLIPWYASRYLNWRKWKGNWNPFMQISRLIIWIE